MAWTLQIPFGPFKNCQQREMIHCTFNKYLFNRTWLNEKRMHARAAKEGLGTFGITPASLLHSQLSLEFLKHAVLL